MRVLIMILFGAWTVAAMAQEFPSLPTTCPAGFPVSLDKVPFGQRPLHMVRIPAGKIEMPTTRPGLKNEVVEVKSIWISMTEIMWDHYDPWRLCMDIELEVDKSALANKSRPSQPYSNPDRNYGVDGFAAIGITANSAQWYCKWLSQKSGHKYRLPTEAEWEYACRAGGPPLRPDKAALAEVAWFEANSLDQNGDPAPHPICTRRPNAWGLYDMLGNIGEWVAGYDGRPVLKGGSYMDPAEKVNSTSRAPYQRAWQLRDPQAPPSKWWLSDGPHAGFRIVRED